MRLASTMRAGTSPVPTVAQAGGGAARPLRYTITAAGSFFAPFAPAFACELSESG